MKIAVVCANGKAGQLIVKEALSRGLDVTAVVRGGNRTEASQVIQKDLYDLTAADLKGFDVVVDAFGAWTEDTLPQHSTSLKHLCDILSGTDVRLLVVGGAGSLYVNPEHTAQVMDGPDFPDAFRQAALFLFFAVTSAPGRGCSKSPGATSGCGGPTGWWRRSAGGWGTRFGPPAPSGGGCAPPCRGAPRRPRRRRPA